MTYHMHSMEREKRPPSFLLLKMQQPNILPYKYVSPTPPYVMHFSEEQTQELEYETAANDEDKEDWLCC